MLGAVKKALCVEHVNIGTFWYYLKCVGVSTKLYEILQTDEGKHFHWFCDDCDSVVMMELCNIAVRCDKSESELNQNE